MQVPKIPKNHQKCCLEDRVENWKDPHRWVFKLRSEESGGFKAAVEFHEDFLPLPLSPILLLWPMVMGRAWVVVMRSKGCWNHSLTVCASDSMGILVYLFSLADLIFTMSVHPSYWLVRGKPPLNLLLIWKVWLHATNWMPTDTNAVYSGENALHFFQPWWKCSLPLSAMGQSCVLLTRLMVIVGGEIYNMAHLCSSEWPQWSLRESWLSSPGSSWWCWPALPTGGGDETCLFVSLLFLWALCSLDDWASATLLASADPSESGSHPSPS